MGKAEFAKVFANRDPARQKERRSQGIQEFAKVFGFGGEQLNLRRVLESRVRQTGIKIIYDLQEFAKVFAWSEG